MEALIRTKFCVHKENTSHYCFYCRLTAMGVKEAIMEEFLALAWKNCSRSYGPEGCKDCGGINEPYMVKNRVWKAAKLKRGYVCLDCLENRLHRRLLLSDFTSAAINYAGLNYFDIRTWLKQRDKP